LIGSYVALRTSVCSMTVILSTEQRRWWGWRESNPLDALVPGQVANLLPTSPSGSDDGNRTRGLLFEGQGRDTSTLDVAV
jgi:hypothetical protein